MNRPNGTVRGLSYDASGELRQIEERNADGLLLVLQRYAYDADGRLVSRFALPRSHPLPDTSDVRTYDADNRLASFNGTAVGHDADGNLTWGSLTAESFAAYTFDVRNRLTHVGGMSYGYNAEDHPTSMTTEAGTTHYVIDPHGGDPPRVLMRQPPDGRQTLYVYGLGLLYEADTSGDVKYCHWDKVGSTVALSDALRKRDELKNASPSLPGSENAGRRSTLPPSR